NLVTPLKKAPALFGKSVPGNVAVPVKPKAPPAAEMPPPPPPVEGVPAIAKLDEPKPVTPPPTVAKPPRVPRPDVIRKMPDLNRRAFSVEEDVEAGLGNALPGMEAEMRYAADRASTKPQSGGGGETKQWTVLCIHGA